LVKPRQANDARETIRRPLQELVRELASDDAPIFAAVAKVVDALNRSNPCGRSQEMFFLLPAASSRSHEDSRFAAPKVSRFRRSFPGRGDQNFFTPVFIAEHVISIAEL
jgi:hypothetical protein